MNMNMNINDKVYFHSLQNGIKIHKYSGIIVEIKEHSIILSNIFNEKLNKYIPIEYFEINKTIIINKKKTL